MDGERGSLATLQSALGGICLVGYDAHPVVFGGSGCGHCGFQDERCAYGTVEVMGIAEGRGWNAGNAGKGVGF